MFRSFANKVVDIVEDLAVYAGEAFGAHSGAYCEIDTLDSPTIMATKASELVSTIEILGIRHQIGPDEFEKVCEELTRSFSNVLSVKGHAIQIWFQRDKDMTKTVLRNALKPSRATIQRINLDLEDVLDSKVDHLPKFCANERILLTVWTTKAVLTKQTETNSDKQRTTDYKQEPGVFRQGSQNIVGGNPSIREIHLTAISDLVISLTASGFVARVMDAHDALREARLSIAEEMTSENWRPCLVGDPAPALQMRHDEDVSHFVYPPISGQIYPVDMQRSKDRKWLTVGSRTYAPLFVEIPPLEIMPFNRLFNALDGADVPWRISYYFESGGVNSISLRGSISSFLTWANSYNTLIHESVKALTDASVNGATIVKGQISLCTWARADRPTELADRVSRLSKAVTGWGRAEVREYSGDPAAGVASSMPIIYRKSVANHFGAPVEDIVRLLPVDRLASAWEKGGVIFRTIDGRIIPFEPGSPQQSTWNYLFFARPGMGKSVLMATINFASCVGGGRADLPYISYIDIGPSSMYFVDLIRSSLPENRQHLAVSFKLQMTPDFSVNFLDTQLGMRQPLPSEMSFIRDYLTLLATPAEREVPYDSMSDLCSKIIEEVYRVYSDGPKSKPKMYTAGVCPEVDSKLEQYGHYIEPGTSWWEVVDYLFDKGEVHEASMAQRFAVPTLEDVAAIANDPAIADLYGGVIIKETSEPLNRIFARIITDTVRSYPIISSVTRFDIGSAKIISIDLNDVAKGGDSNPRNNAIVYMLARYISMRNFRIDGETYRYAPKMYEEFYKQKADEVFGSMKWVIFDEFHQTSGSKIVRSQVARDMREGRKWNIGVMLASQSIDDFDEQMKEFASAVFILNAGTSSNATRLQNIFGFNDTSRNLLLNYANGPNEKGAPFLCQFSTDGDSGSFSQFLYSSISPIETWAFSTSSEDVMVRKKLSAIIGNRAARNILAKVYPGGSCRKDIQRRKGEDDGSDEDKVRHIIDVIVSELVQKSEALQAAKT